MAPAKVPPDGKRQAFYPACLLSSSPRKIRPLADLRCRSAYQPVLVKAMRIMSLAPSRAKNSIPRPPDKSHARLQKAAKLAARGVTSILSVSACRHRALPFPQALTGRPQLWCAGSGRSRRCHSVAFCKRRRGIWDPLQSNLLFRVCGGMVPDLAVLCRVPLDVVQPERWPMSRAVFFRPRKH